MKRKNNLLASDASPDFISSKVLHRSCSIGRGKLTEKRRKLPILGDDVAGELDLLLAAAAELLEGALELALQRRRLAHDGAGELGERAAPAGVAGAVHLLELPRRRAGRAPRAEIVAARPLHARPDAGAEAPTTAKRAAGPLTGPAVVAQPEHGPVLLLVQERLREEGTRTSRHGNAQFTGTRARHGKGGRRRRRHAGAHLVGLADGLEARLGLGLGRRRVLVGVPFLDEVLVRGADFLRRGVLGDVEDLVVQLRRVPHRRGLGMEDVVLAWRRGKQRTKQRGARSGVVGGRYKVANRGGRWGEQR